MVHCFSYNHQGIDRHFIYDIESGSLLNVDRECYLVAKNKFGELTEREFQEYNVISPSNLSEISEDLAELDKDGSLNSPDTTPIRDKAIGSIKALCLHICHDCNMRCKYCFAGEGNYHTERHYMSAEVGCRAVDFLIVNSGNRVNLEVDFFGGEPLMNLDVVKKIVSYARERERESGKVFSFTMTTNCLLLSDEYIAWLDSEMSNVVLSIDGRRDVHNAVRKTVNGKDCYDVVLNNALKMAKARGQKSHYVRGTFTAQNLDFASDILYLRDMGFEQISVEPVVLEPTHELAIRQEHIGKILEEYERLASEYLKSRKDGKWFNFFHFMLDLEGGPCIAKRLTGCGAGCEYLSVTPTGGIYPCHQFAEKEGYCLGNVLTDEFSLDVSKNFAKNVVTKKTVCKNCFAKYYCSGGCAANNNNFAGDINTPYDLSCQMMKKRFELSLAISAIERCE